MTCGSLSKTACSIWVGTSQTTWLKFDKLVNMDTLGGITDTVLSPVSYLVPVPF